MSVPRYPSYRSSGVEWLGDIPAHWSLSRLKWSTANVKNGIWGDDPKGDENDVPCLRVADFDRTKLLAVLNEPTIRNVTQAEQHGRLLRKGDLLLEKSGGGEHQPVGCVVLYDYDTPAVCSNFVARVRCSQEQNPQFWRYVHAAAYAVRLNTRAIKQTSGIQNLDHQQYFDESAAFPPYGEQLLIARFLDHETGKVDGLVAEQQNLIRLLKEKRQAIISHAVTKGLNAEAPMKTSSVEWLGPMPEHWEVRSLSSVTTKITNGYVGPTRDILVDEGVRYLQSLHIKDNRIRFDVPYFVTEEWSKQHSKSILESGDVLIVQTGDIGQVAVVTDDFAGCNCHALIVVAPVRAIISGEWLAWCLNSDYGFHTLLSIQTGALHPHLNCGNVKYIAIPLPPLDEQGRIVNHIEEQVAEFDALIAEAERAIALLHERRTALISAAVTGKIDVRHLADAEAA